MKTINLSTELERSICSEFSDISKTIKSICSNFNLSKTRIVKVLKKYNIPSRRSQRVNFFNENYFNKIDSPEKAQILGFLYADGCIYKSVLSASLEASDKEYLLNILKNLSAPLSLLKIRKSYKTINPQGNLVISKDQYRFQLSSKILYNDCLKCGLVERKSWANLGFPSGEILSNSLKKYFILGVLEGDGTIGIGKNKRCFIGWYGSEKLLNDIRKHILKELNIKLPSISKNRTCFSLVYSKKDSIKKIIKWLYDENTSFTMLRKKEKAQIILNLINKKI